MKGLTWSTLRKEYSLIPLFVIVGGTMIGSAAYTLRLAMKNPDVAWVKKEKCSNDDYTDRQYKFYSPSIDYSQLKSPAPKYE